jgi:dipeptidase E
MYNTYLARENYSSVLFIDTAAEVEIGKTEGDDKWFFDDLQSLRSVGYTVDRWSVTGKSIPEIENMLEAHDILYMSGGHTIYLLQQLQNTGAFQLIAEKVRSGKTYIGTSAGSIIAGPHIPQYIEEPSNYTVENHIGFNFIGQIIIPHWGSDLQDYKIVQERLKNMYHDAVFPFLLLHDSQYVAVKEIGKNIEVVNTKKTTHKTL